MTKNWKLFFKVTSVIVFLISLYLVISPSVVMEVEVTQIEQTDVDKIITISTSTGTFNPHTDTIYLTEQRNISENDVVALQNKVYSVDTVHYASHPFIVQKLAVAVVGIGVLILGWKPEIETQIESFMG